MSKESKITMQVGDRVKFRSWVDRCTSKDYRKGKIVEFSEFGKLWSEETVPFWWIRPDGEGYDVEVNENFIEVIS